jgi:hypothetical protein
MQSTSRGRVRRLGGIAAAAVLVVFGAAAVAMGLDGRSTVRSALRQEGVVGGPHMTPAAIATMAKQAGLHGVALPTCSVAAKPVNHGAAARCFAEYMRIDALMATNGATYAQLPAFATRDGKARTIRRGRDAAPTASPSTTRPAASGSRRPRSRPR